MDASIMDARRGIRTMLGLGLGAALLLGAVGGGASMDAQEGTPMSTDETRTTMEQYADALLGGGAYETFFTADVVVTMTGVDGEIRGQSAAKEAIDALHQQQFTAQPEIASVVVGSGQAALELVFVGTHTGEFAGIAPTGKDVRVPYSVFYQLEGGKISALRIYALAEGLIQQLQAA